MHTDNSDKKTAEAGDENESFWMPLFVKTITLGFCLLLGFYVVLLLGVLAIAVYQEFWLCLLMLVGALISAYLFLILTIYTYCYLNEKLSPKRKALKVHWNGSHWRKELEFEKVEVDPMEDIKRLIRLQDKRFEARRKKIEKILVTSIILSLIFATIFHYYFQEYPQSNCWEPFVSLELDSMEKEDGDYEIVVNQTSFYPFKGEYGHNRSFILDYFYYFLRDLNGSLVESGVVALRNLSTDLDGNIINVWQGIDMTWDGETASRHPLYGGPYYDPVQAQIRIDAIKVGYQEANTSNQRSEGNISVSFQDMDHDGLMSNGDRFFVRTNRDGATGINDWQLEVRFNSGVVGSVRLGS